MFARRLMLAPGDLNWLVSKRTGKWMDAFHRNAMKIKDAGWPETKRPTAAHCFVDQFENRIELCYPILGLASRGRVSVDLLIDRCRYSVTLLILGHFFLASAARSTISRVTRWFSILMLP